VEGQFVRRIVAVGDLHGDYNNAFKVLHMADVVDANGSWTGNVDYFVQTGDIVDRCAMDRAHVLNLGMTNALACRGDDTIKIYRWMETLREQARHAGGYIFSHLGNHEFMNALGKHLPHFSPPGLTDSRFASKVIGGRSVMRTSRPRLALDHP